MHLDHVGPGWYDINLLSMVKIANQTNGFCECVGVPICTSVYNDQHRLPNVSANVIKVMYHQQRAI